LRRAHTEAYNIYTSWSFTYRVSNVERLGVNSNLNDSWDWWSYRESKCLDFTRDCDNKVFGNRSYSLIACQWNFESHIESANISHRGCGKTHRRSWDS
jgi:hypothetical protein